MMKNSTWKLVTRGKLQSSLLTVVGVIVHDTSLMMCQEFKLDQSIVSADVSSGKNRSTVCMFWAIKGVSLKLYS